MLFKLLFSSNDKDGADSVLFILYVSIVGLLGLAFYQAVWNHMQIGIGEAGTGLAAVIGAAGAIRVGRDHMCQREDADDHH